MPGSTKNALPPQAINPFVAVDEGWCSPRYLRMTLNHLPTSAEVLDMCRVPMAAVVQPLAMPARGEYNPQTVDFQVDEGPVRCGRCRAYVNPFMQFLDYGRQFRCNICGYTNEVPGFYVCSLDEYGRRRDRLERPELYHGCVDIVVPASYNVREPVEPIFVFAVDVSYYAVGSGSLLASLRAIRESLDHLPGGERVRVGIVAYDTQMYAFNVSSAVSEPQMAVMADVDDPFSPLPPDSWLPQLATSRAHVEAVLDRIPEMFADTRAMQGCSGAVIKACVDGLKDLGGRLAVFQSTISSVGYGRLASREQPRHYATENERKMYTPLETDEAYKALSVEAAEAKVCVDTYVTTSSFVDVATTQRVNNRTGGEVRLYPDFWLDPASISSRAATARTRSASGSGEPMFECGRAPAEVEEKLVQDVVAQCRREIAFDAVMKMRVSKGLTVREYIGNCHEAVAGEPEIAGVDSEKSFVVTLEHEGDELVDGGKAYLQFAMLFTRPDGLRVVRCLNTELDTTSAIANVYRYSDMDSTMNIFMRRAASMARTAELRDIKDMFSAGAIDILHLYRKFCSPHSSAAQLILPESLKLMPVYFCAALKVKAFCPNRIGSGGAIAAGGRVPVATDIRADARAAALQRLQFAGAHTSVVEAYGRLYAVHNMPAHAGFPAEGTADDPDAAATGRDRIVMPPQEWVSAEKVDLHGVYLLETGVEIMVYVGEAADREVCEALFGVPDAKALAALPAMSAFVPRESTLSQRVWNIIRQIRTDRPPYVPITVVTPDSPLKAVFNSRLVEDRVAMVDSYVEYLCALHAAIQNRFQ